MKVFLLGSSLVFALAACNGVSNPLDDNSTPPAPTTTKDTLLLAGDTTQRVTTSHWNGSTLESQEVSVIPVTEFVWLINHYGEPVVMEAWAGDSLEWRNGNVLGYHLQALPNPNARATPLANGARRRLSARRQTEILVVAGIPSGASAEFLSVRHYFGVVAGDSLVLDNQGLLQISR